MNGLHLFWDSFEWFLSPNMKWCKIFFLSCPRHCDWGLIVVIVYCFQIWNIKENNMIISRVISSHMNPVCIIYIYVKTQNIFLSCPRHFDRGLIVVIVYSFQNWNKKEHDIIFRRVVSRHVDPIYIETPCINGLHLFWDSFERYCLQISCDGKYFFLSCPRHCNRGLIVVIIYSFQIWKKKEHSIIISWAISRHMGSMYIETPYIYIYILVE